MGKRIFYILLLLIVAVSVTLFILSRTDYRKLLYSNSSENIKEAVVDSTALKDIQLNIDTIIKYSSIYGISPKAIMGIIVAERSLHGGPANQFEEYYVEQAFLGKSDSYLEDIVLATKANVEKQKLKGESDKDFNFRLKNGLIWTIGLCQISIMKSIEIDSLISIRENKKANSIKENIRCLLNSNSNIKFCAFELKTISETFKEKTGLDISNNVGILCTLYNTGKVSTSISKYIRTKANPQANSFGQFAEFQSSLFDDILNKTTPNKRFGKIRADGSYLRHL